jgi:murein DD-endopeptidase MepM/ murein hydrolase activator NlpD
MGHDGCPAKRIEPAIAGCRGGSVLSTSVGPHRGTGTARDEREQAASEVDEMAVMSRGTYRIPYQTGTEVEVTRDHRSHEPPNRIDMKGVGAGEPYRIVAAADGVIRFIVDHFSENRPDQDPCNNNYVWIEHPNGEWTKYSHMTKDSVTVDAGLSVGDHVTAGTFLGCEDEVGCASGEHLHFEVAMPADPGNAINSEGFLVGGNRDNRIPRICGLSSGVFVDGARYTAGSCPPTDEPSWLEPALHVIRS